MRTLVMLVLLCSCASTHKIKENLYLVDCDGIFGDCKGEMEKTCPKGYKKLNERTVINPNNARSEIHFECVNGKTETEVAVDE